MDLNHLCLHLAQMVQKDARDNKLSKSKRLSIYTIFFSVKGISFVALKQVKLILIQNCYFDSETVLTSVYAK